MVRDLADILRSLDVTVLMLTHDLPDTLELPLDSTREPPNPTSAPVDSLLPEQ